MSRYRKTFTEALKEVRESKQKPYVSMSSGGQYNVLDAEGKTVYSTRDQRLAQDYFKKNYDKLKEQDEKDHEVSMARGELEAIADKATQLAGALQGKSDEGNPLEAWVQSKITKAKDYINSVSDYLMYNPDMKQNEELEEGDAYDNNRYMMKKYMGQILARPDNSNTKDGKDHVYAPNAQIAKQLYKQGKKVYREESDHEVSMARGELEAIADKASQLAGALQGKSDEGNPLEAWVQSKITKAKDYINSVSDYLTYDPSMKQNEETLEEKFALYALRDFTDTRAPGGMRKKGDRASGPMTYTQAIKKAKQMNAGSSIGGSKDVEVRPMKEETILEYTQQQIKQAYGILNDPRYKGGNYDGAVAAIEKLAKGLSKQKDVANALKRANEETSKELQKDRTDNYKDKNKELEEKFTVQITKKDGTTMELGRYNTAAEAQRFVDMYGKGAKVKKEEVELEEASLKDIFTANQEGQKADEIAKKLKMSVADVKKILGEETLDEKTYDDKEIDKFHTDLDKIVHKHFGHSSKEKEKMDEKVADSIIKDLQKAYADLKGKTISPQMATKISKHLDKPSYNLNTLRQLVKANIPFISTLARNKIYKKTGKFEDLKEEDGVEIAKIRADRDKEDKKEVA